MREAFCILFILVGAALAECPTKEDLTDDADVPTVTQVDSNTALVDWRELWQFMDWSECVSKVRILMSGDDSGQEVEVEDFEIKNASIAVVPCKEVTFEVEVTLADSQEVVKSFSTDRDFKTFRSPLAREDPSVGLSYHVNNDGEIDLTAVDIKFGFESVVQDPGCHRIKATELRYRKVATGTSEHVWTVAKSTGGVFRTLEETVSGLDDVCSPYEFVLQLLGTEGTSPSPVHLGRLEPVSVEQLLTAYDSGFKYRVPPPRNLTLDTATANSVSVSWLRSGCSSGYRVTLMEGNSIVKIANIPGDEEARVTFSGLRSCAVYSVDIKAMLDVGQDRQYESGPEVISAITKADDKFSLASFRYRSGRTSVTVSWSVKEYPCFEDITARLCPLPRNGQQEEECSEEQPGSSHIVEDRKVVTFQNLQPCTNYKAVLRPVLGLGPEYEYEWQFVAVLSTRINVRPPQNLEVIEAAETSVILRWTTDTCVDAYIITYSSHLNTNIIEGTRSFKASTLELIPFPQNSSRMTKGAGKEDEDSGEELSIERGNTLDRSVRSSPEYEEYAAGQLDYEADFEAAKEEEEAVRNHDGSGTKSSIIVSDDEDYESDLGSGSGQDEEDEEDDLDSTMQKFHVSVNVNGLEPCTEYTFRVQNFYIIAGVDKFGEKSLVKESTACVTTTMATTTTAAAEDALSVFNVEELVSEEETKLHVSWKQLRSNSVVLRVSSVVLNISSFREVVDTNDLATEYEHISKTVSVEGCHEYLIEILHQEEIAWSTTIVTAPNERHPLELSSFSLDIVQLPGRGTANVTWIHDLSCVTHYKLVLSTENATGEMMIPTPAIGQIVNADLHMLPGMLNLKNCESYQLQILPKSSNPASLMTLSEWHKGFSKSFRYVTDGGNTPNLLQASKMVQLDIQSHTVRLHWNEALSCRGIKLLVSSDRNIHAHDGYKKRIVEVALPTTTSSYTVGDLLSCINYELEIVDGNPQETTLLTKPFKTIKDPNAETEKLNHDEIIEWKEEDSVEVQLEWSDRCRESYKVLLCRLPCEEEEEMISVEGSEGNPTLILDTVEPCSLYRYSIHDEKALVLYNGNFSTNFRDNFAFAPILQLDPDKLTASWPDHNPCIGSYHLTLRQDQKSIRASEKITKPADEFRVMLDLKEVFPALTMVQCSEYSLVIKPRLQSEVRAAEEDWDERNEFVHTFFYFTNPEPPANIDVSVINPSSVKISWSHLACHSGYLLQLSDNLGKKIGDLTTVDGSTAVKMVENLLPCTQYKVQIWSSSSNGQVSEESSEHTFMTSHSDEVDIAATVGYESIDLEVNLHGTDCVDRYLLHLCNYETIRHCWNQTAVDNKAVIFQDLKEGQPYSYQLIAYNKHGTEVFFTPEYHAKTKMRISGTLVVDKVTFDSIQLQLQTSLQDINEWSADIVCQSDDDIVVSNITNDIIATFDKLAPNTNFICSGTLNHGGERAELKAIKVRTPAGIPQAPLFLMGKMESQNTIRLTWEEPIITNGVILDYQVTAQPECRKSNNLCPAHCPESKTKFTGITSALLELEPSAQYTFTVSARTENPMYGPFSNPFLFKTPATKPNPPEIVFIEATKKNSILVNFTHPCPTTGPTDFSVGYKCNRCKFEPKAVRRRRGEFSFEITDLLGGHFYDVWVTATVDGCNGDCQVSSASKVAFVECEYMCRDGTCINRGPGNVRCNFIRDCPDGSDEDGCSCDPPHKFKCANNYCIGMRKRCDGNADCNDFSDEFGCPTCTHNQFRCETTKECIAKNMTCDRKVNCRDGSDEHGCAYWTSTCWPEQFRCLDHTCVDIKHRCDGIWDCVGGEDELSCNRLCPEGEKFACKNRQCIPREKFCDGVPDCKDGSDELYECTCQKTGQFACKYENQCIARLRVCDGKADCKDGSDEMMCGKKVPNKAVAAEEGDLPASKNNKKIVKEEETLQRDAYSKQPRRSKAGKPTRPPLRKESTTKTAVSVTYPDFDYLEIRPVTISPPLYDTDLQSANQVKSSDKKEKTKYNLKTYPDSQWVYLGDDVVIQCRDEGIRRAPVSWRRKDGKSLPKAAEQDSRGRLVLPGVDTLDQGAYVCFVEGADESQVGATKVSIVSVRYRRRS